MQEVIELIIEQLKSEVKRWEDSGTEYKDKCEIAVGRGLRNAIEIVKQEAEKYDNGWISCSERLPNKEEFLKAYIRNKYGAEFIVMIEGANRPTTLYLTTDGLSVLCLAAFGADDFILPSMIAILAVLTLLRKPLDKGGEAV